MFQCGCPRDPASSPTDLAAESSVVEAMAALFPEVPVEVEANICTTWAEK